MNFLDIKTEDVMNGNGMRTTLFVSGCNHGCKGCYNKSSWPLDAGQKFDYDVTLKYLLDTLKPSYIKGLSISGGDPLHPKNYNMVRFICDVVKQTYPDKDIWLWTGYRLEDLNDHQLSALRSVDKVMDGRYMQNKPTIKPFRGSDNQRLIDMKTDIKYGEQIKVINHA